MELFTKGKEFCKKIIEGLNYSATPYHVVERAKTLLTSAGFKEIKERY
jgi:aspartyl aminopeptidase